MNLDVRFTGQGLDHLKPTLANIPPGRLTLVSANPIFKRQSFNLFTLGQLYPPSKRGRLRSTVYMPQSCIHLTSFEIMRFRC